MILLENITLAYGDRLLLDGVTAEIRAGESTALIGRNGTGKSTLLRAVAGVGPDTLRNGRIVIGKIDTAQMKPAERARTVSVVTTDKCRIANLRVDDAVALGRAPYTNWIGRMQADDRRIVAESLEQVGMSDFAGKTMDSLSDGEAQRVMIARALAQRTPVILLDEPTAFLDMPARYELCALLRRLAREEGKCILFSTHELDIAMRICDRVAVVDTPSLYVGTPDEILRDGIVARLFSGMDAGLEELCAGIDNK